MVETMYAAPGVGLAAPQIGVPLRVFVDRHVRRQDGGELIALVNPEFVDREGMQLEEEGCLSVPGFNATVVRPTRAVVQGSIATGSRATIEGTDCWRARFSTRWIISTARSSSIACAASSAT